MERELRQMFDIKETDMVVPSSLSPELRKRIGRQRMALSGLAVAAFLALAIGGFAGAQALTNDEALPPVNPDSDVFAGTWFSTDIDGSSQTMTIEASGEDAFEIDILDDSAGVCSGASSTMTGTGAVDGPRKLVIPEPVFVCDDGSEPESDTGEPIEDLIADFTFVHDPQADTLTDNIGVTWGRESAPSVDCTRLALSGETNPECNPAVAIPEAEVISGNFEGAPWQLSLVATRIEEGLPVYLRGTLGDEVFAAYSWLNLDGELKATVAGVAVEQRTPPLAKNGLQDALVIFGAVPLDVTRVEFTEGGETVSAETIAPPPEFGDDFRVFVIFAPNGTNVGCLWGDVTTVNCFGRRQTVTSFNEAGEVVSRETLHPETGSGARQGLLGDDALAFDRSDPNEFSADGSEGGLHWRFHARRFGIWTQVPSPTPNVAWQCFDFSLTQNRRDLDWEGTNQLQGGLGCLNRPGPDWFGTVAQRVEPERSDVAPVYGAIPPEIEAVTVLLDDGSEIPARIYRPENHPVAYFLAWIPGAYSRGSVRFSAGGNEVGTRPLCAGDYSERTERFVCYGTEEAE